MPIFSMPRTARENFGITCGRLSLPAVEASSDPAAGVLGGYGCITRTLAADPDVARRSAQSLSSGQLARVYGFTDLDGSQPDAWRYLVEVQDAGRPADATGYR